MQIMSTNRPMHNILTEMNTHAEHANQAGAVLLLSGVVPSLTIDWID